MAAVATADDEGGKVLQLHWGHIAATDDQAWDEAAPHFHHLMSVYQEFANASGGQGGPKPGQVPPIEELRNPEERLMFRPVIGAPDTVAATLNRVFGRVPGTHLAMGMLPGMPPERSRRFIDRLVREVVPQLD